MLSYMLALTPASLLSLGSSLDGFLGCLVELVFSPHELQPELHCTWFFSLTPSFSVALLGLFPSPFSDSGFVP